MNEIRHLKEQAGKVSLEQLARTLKRSPASVYSQARRNNLSTRHYQSELFWCSECATWRSRTTAHGDCLVCERRKLHARAVARFSTAYDGAPPEVKTVYRNSESKRRSRPLPMPIPNSTSGMDNYHAAMEYDRHCMAIEAWELQRLNKLINNEKQRLCRLRKHTGSNPRIKTQPPA